jgi:hypothetical protein
MPRKEVILPPPVPRRVSVFIKIFVAIHIVAITSWSLPTSPKNEKLGIDKTNAKTVFQSTGRLISDGTLYLNDNYVKDSPLKFYLLFTGFWQYWDMFSPNPAGIDFYGTYTITYMNGSKQEYTFPRMYELPISKKYITERYRKFYERAHTEGDKWEWPIFAQRVALAHYTDKNNPPVSVALTRHWYTITYPEDLGYSKLVIDWNKQHKGQKLDPATDAEFHKKAHEDAMHVVQESDYKSYTYYTYSVNQQRLAKDKAAGVFG